MSSEVAISVKDLSKCYQIYAKPQDRLKQMLFRRRRYYNEAWAVRDVSFEVKRGETVGIIGRNGSGKSTILQMICGTLNPTGGQITTNGRIAALLELGSGFNPEFTGRENVYLAASLYGLSRDEITRRFDRIAQFADIGDYIDQPVRTYSSGMYVRLAFAVIAHVDADILVVDEALAVGDAVFTQKCMRFIREFKKNGTLLFVSHDMGSVINLCERAVWMHQGQLRESGHSKDIAEEYLQYTLQEVYGEEAKLEGLRQPASIDNHSSDRAPEIEATQAAVVEYPSNFQTQNNLSAANGWKSGAGEIVSVRLSRLSGEDGEVLKGGEVVRMSIRAVLHKDFTQPILGFLVRDRLGQDLFGENTLPFSDSNPCTGEAGETIEGHFVFRLPMLPNGQYVVMSSLADGDQHNHVQHHWMHDALVINVSSSKVRWGLVGVPFEAVTLVKTP
ncbi:ABC transporter ATP-binding protein [Pseudomonas saliphila]|uniref:ABC transporter ATP-binding protein n=1 Tax=Pseudomonas saliphila TaxID=2586906 RepID=UPI0012394215|nr:ABC transporter ATP-binding protein [Pseudomonas saliphila]